MAALRFPCTIFKTQKRMNDDGAEDMRYGDLNEAQLKNDFHLLDVSTRVDPYRLRIITPFNQPQSMSYGMHGAGKSLTPQACASILFDEMRHLSQSFALYGPYKHLIQQMITHMQQADGAPFRSLFLNRALKGQIMNDRHSKNSTYLRLKTALKENIDWVEEIYHTEEKSKLTESINNGRLPKFNRLQDNINGMGITVHDVWATHITIKSLRIKDGRYQAHVHYKIQDHFGLDSHDILKAKFNLFRFFRIWFILQRYNRFGFKPFITNMETTIEINGKLKE